MTAPVTAFSHGRRIFVDHDADLVVVATKRHADKMTVAAAYSRLKLYQGLYAKRPKFYREAMSAAQRAVDIIETIKADEASQ